MARRRGSSSSQSSEEEDGEFTQKSRNSSSSDSEIETRNRGRRSSRRERVERRNSSDSEDRRVERERRKIDYEDDDGKGGNAERSGKERESDRENSDEEEVDREGKQNIDSDKEEDDERDKERSRKREEASYRDRDYGRKHKSRGESRFWEDNERGGSRKDRAGDEEEDGDKKLGRRDANGRHGDGYRRTECEEHPYRSRERDRKRERDDSKDRRWRSNRHEQNDDKGQRRRERGDRYRGREDDTDYRKERRERDRERVRREKDERKDRSSRKDDAEDMRKSAAKEDMRSAKEKGDDGKVNDDLKAPKLENLGRSGGVYIPPFKLARMLKEVQDKSSVEYQRLTWDALRKSINGLVNKVNATNIKNIIPELFAENLIRGRGLFCRSCMKSQMASPSFTDVFAALVAIVNTKFPEVGELLLKRIILQLQRAYKRNDKPQLLAAVKFIAHLVNQQVVHELIALELLTVLLENPTDDSVEVAVGFVTECGSILEDLCPKGLHGIFERFRGILHEGEIDKRVQFLIEGLFAIRKAKFQGYPAVRAELDLVEQEDQLTHEISLSDQIDPEIALDIFKQDPNFLENEKKYEDLKKSILGEESEDDEAGSDEGSDVEDEDVEESDEDDEVQMKIQDETETNLINLRRTIYLTIMSSVDFEEAGHKLLKIKLEPGQEMELCIMLLECCSQERTYLRYYGLLGQRFCMINKIHQENFDICFANQYSMIHRLETNKLRNVAKFFAHLLGTNALPWQVLGYIRLTEDDTTSSSRIFIKILFQELSEHLGIRLLNERLNDPTMQESLGSIFPKDNPKNSRFAINFFTSIGLGGITENLREYLKNMPRIIMQQQKPVSESEDESSSSSSSGSDSSGSDSESESSSSEESESDDRRRKRRRNR